MEKKVRVAIAGLGGRGKDTYPESARMFPDKMEIVAIADPIEEKRRILSEEFHIAPEMCFSTAEELLQREKLADVIFICTQDRQHYAQTMAALKKGYHVLLEKPIAPRPEECADIVRMAKACGRHVQVCHVLRYSPFFRNIKRLIDSGCIGQVVAVCAIENVQYWHQAHSFVRGNWANEETSSPMILAKCCHDLDILLWLVGKKSRYVSSYGGLYLFRPEKAPRGAAFRCTDGCRARENCPYDAEKIYIRDRLLKGEDKWPVNILNDHPTEENIRQALKEGQYGRCVYYAGNDVVDHQVVNIELEDGVSISLTMSAFTSRGGRNLKIMGTLGDLEADMESGQIRLGVFGKEPEMIDGYESLQNPGGHGGGDLLMVEELLDDILEGKEPGSGLTSIEKSVESHYIAFAAEESRLHHGESISMEEWIRKIE